MQGVQAPLPVRAAMRKRYIVESLLGKGSSGAVYLVRYPHIKDARQNLFVLKEVIVPNEQERNRFFHKASQLRALRHGGLPRLYESFQDDKNERIYFLMEYVDGESLENLLQNLPEQQFSWNEAMTVMVPVIATVSCLHHQQPPIIHGDIKPANIIALKTGFIRSLLVDFRLEQKSSPLSSTPDYDRLSSYRAPEQYGGEVEVSSDIYGLGATFYRLLTGIAPASAPERITSLARASIDPLKSVHEVKPVVPAHIGEVVDRAMALDAGDRFTSVDEFWSAFWASKERTLRVAICPPESSEPAIVGQMTEAVPERVHAHRYRKLALPFILLLAFVAWIPIGHYFSADTTASTRKLAVSPSLPATVPGSNLPGARAYTGTIFDVAANSSASLSFSNVQQDSGRIRGHLSTGPALRISGSFSGTIDAAHRIRFMVIDSTGNALFFFEGMVQSSTSMSGNYYGCGHTERNPCVQSSSDYGIWNATAAVTLHMAVRLSHCTIM